MAENVILVLANDFARADRSYTGAEVAMVLRTLVPKAKDGPPCPRCGQPCHKVPVPLEQGDPSWVWGHDCDPYDYPA